MNPELKAILVDLRRKWLAGGELDKYELGLVLDNERAEAELALYIKRRNEPEQLTLPGVPLT